jgi:hypothetical protein
LQVREFNANNRYRKRGLAVSPTKFGIAFTAKFMNQGFGCCDHRRAGHKGASDRCDRTRWRTRARLHRWHSAGEPRRHRNGPGPQHERSGDTSPRDARLMRRFCFFAAAVCQVAARVFGIPMEDVHVSESATDKVQQRVGTRSRQVNRGCRSPTHRHRLRA